jgi:O-acetyl-ADP-ribose deacetylase (regulator of RNase III)
MEYSVNHSTLRFLQGDITKIPADAIVNAANSQLAGGGGVDGAIHWAGGPAIMAELDQIRSRIGRCPAGDAVVTGAGRLPAKYVIHAVGPIYHDGHHGEPEALASCYRRSLELAAQYSACDITFPAISTGVYGYPRNDAARVSIAAVIETLRKPGCAIESATFVLFGADALQSFEAAASELLGGPSV